jgi:hypothetical protein
MKRRGRITAGALLAAAVAGCGLAPLQQDQPVYLLPGQGLAAVMLDTLDPLTQVIIEPRGSGGTKLDIASVPSGKNIYLFPVPAGQYCFTRFQYGRWGFFGKEGELACFEVKAGEIGYSGTLAPRVEDGQVYSHQVMDTDGFRALLTQRYPIIAKQFLPPPPKPYTAEDLQEQEQAPPAVTANLPIPAVITPRKPPDAGKDQISSWIEDIPGTRAEVVFFRNNTGWTIEVRRFELYDCVGVKQACGVQKLKLVLPPHTTKQAIVIEPASPDDAYAFRTRYIYGFVQSGKP